MASETMRRLDEIVGSFREGVIVRVSCGGMLCGECIQCTARAAKVSLQREQRAAKDEIARLTRELEEARERERAVRVAAHDDLAEIAGMLADMHDGEECRFEGGEGCLACYAQGRIGEMQDALTARTTATQGEEEALVQEILAELGRAREKFRGYNVTALAMVEEVGELAKALIDESRDRVREEAVQVAAMAMRVVLDGDQTLDAWRESKGLDPLTAARRGEGGGE